MAPTEVANRPRDPENENDYPHTAVYHYARLGR